MLEQTDRGNLDDIESEQDAESAAVAFALASHLSIFAQMQKVASEPLEQFQEKCETVFPGKAHSAFPWELRQNKEIERFAVSMKR